MRRGRRYSSNPGGEPIYNGPSMDELCELCAERFSSPEFSVHRDDATATVWVSREGVQLSIGIQPNVVERRGLERTLDETDARLSPQEPVVV